MKQKHTAEEIIEVLAYFDPATSLDKYEPIGQGHINATYLVEVTGGEGRKKYTFQRINTFVFQQPELMMANWEKITHHQREKLSEEAGHKGKRQSLCLLLGKDGRSFYRSAKNEYWRAYHYIDRCHTVEVAKNPEQAYEAGKAFGLFQKMVADLNPADIFETIPYFHHTPRRFERFLQALKIANPGRKKRAERAINFALARETVVNVVTAGMASGRLPVRVTHNDTKINNVLFDDETEKGVCVIDLDTTMPGSPLYDFGDLVRTATCQAAEDEVDLGRVKLDLEFFRAVAEGYLSQTADLLMPAEKELLFLAGKLITFTIGLRFLTDYLEGDVYFKISRPEHNLERALTQFQLLSSMEEQEKEMQRVLSSLLT
ncbi:MAG: phosphotransferase enzyme family protein [Candidatus Aminicenantales bacterium]